MACRAPMAALSRPYCMLAVATAQQISRHLRLAKRVLSCGTKGGGAMVGGDGGRVQVLLQMARTRRCAAVLSVPWRGAADDRARSGALARILCWRAWWDLRAVPSAPALWVGQLLEKSTKYVIPVGELKPNVDAGRDSVCSEVLSGGNAKTSPMRGEWPRVMILPEQVPCAVRAWLWLT